MGTHSSYELGCLSRIACNVVPPIYILSRIIVATCKKFTVATVRFTQFVSCNVYSGNRQIHTICQLQCLQWEPSDSHNLSVAMFTMATFVRFTQYVSCNVYSGNCQIHTICQLQCLHDLKKKDFFLVLSFRSFGCVKSFVPLGPDVLPLSLL